MENSIKSFKTRQNNDKKLGIGFNFENIQTIHLITEYEEEMSVKRTNLGL